MGIGRSRFHTHKFESVCFLEPKIAHMCFNGNQSPKGAHIGTRETRGDGRANSLLRQDHPSIPTKPVFFHRETNSGDLLKSKVFFHVVMINF